MLADTGTDEGFLLALLNSTPVIDGVPADDLADRVRARAWLAAAGGRGTEAELRHVLRVRQALQAVVRGQRPAAMLEPELEGVTSVPAIDDGRIGWTLSVARDRELAVRASSTWDALARPSPGRLRRAPTTNAACSSSIAARPTPPGGARWPSAATHEGPPSLPAFTRLAPHSCS